MELEIRNNWDFAMCVGEYLNRGTRQVAGDIWRKREGFLAFNRRFRRSLRGKTEGVWEMKRGNYGCERNCWGLNGMVDSMGGGDA